MPIKIENHDVERLLEEIVQITGETRMEALRRALAERLAQLRRRGTRAREARLRAFLEDEVWPQIPDERLGTPLSKEEEEEVLGFGEDAL